MSRDRVNLALMLDKCLEELAAGASLEECLDRFKPWQNQLQPLLRTAQRLHATPRPAPSPAFAERSRQRLLERIEAEREQNVTNRKLLRFLRQKQESQPGRRRFSMSGLIAALVLLAALSGGGLVHASQDTLPGDILYHVKAVVEAARLMATTRDQDRAALQWQLADVRLAEAARAAREGRETALVTALQGYTALLQEATANEEADDAGLNHAQEQLQLHMEILAQVRQQLYSGHASPQAISALDRAMANADDLVQRFQTRVREREGAEQDDQSPQPQQEQPPEQRRQQEMPTQMPEQSQNQERQQEQQQHQETEQQQEMPTQMPEQSQNQDRQQEQQQHQETERQQEMPTQMPEQSQNQDRQQEQQQHQETERQQEMPTQMPEQSQNQDRQQGDGSAPTAQPTMGTEPQASVPPNPQQGGSQTQDDGSEARPHEQSPLQEQPAPEAQPPDRPSQGRPGQAQTSAGRPR